MPQVVSADVWAKSAVSNPKEEDELRSRRLKSASDFGFVPDFCSVFGSAPGYVLCSAFDFSAAENRYADENAAKTATINIQR